MGATEIIFILVIYLLLFGAKGMPSLARTLGSAVREFRSASDEIQREILSSSEGLKPRPTAPRKQSAAPPPSPKEPTESPESEGSKSETPTA
jgi:TatA/E family protein of Tat protein translocase